MVFPTTYKNIFLCKYGMLMQLSVMHRNVHKFIIENMIEQTYKGNIILPLCIFQAIFVHLHLDMGKLCYILACGMHLTDVFHRLEVKKSRLHLSQKEHK